MGKHFIDLKSSEIMLSFSGFSLYDASCPFLAKTAPCPFEILEEALSSALNKIRILDEFPERLERVQPSNRSQWSAECFLPFIKRETRKN
jgi:hypothetical protein